MTYNARNIIALFLSVYFYISGRIRVVKKKAIKGDIIISVYFHNPSKRLFEFIVRWFVKNGFQIISPDQLHQILIGNKPYPSSAVILTVDDGWKENKHCIVKIAKKYKIPVTIFITTSPIETGEAFWWSYISAGKKNKLTNYTVNELKNVTNEKRIIEVNKIKNIIKLNKDALTIDEVIEISNDKLITIGSHTVSHPILTKCTDSVSKFEISESKEIISNWINKPVKYFAYPNGNYSDREINYLKQSKYELAFTTVPRYIERNGKTDQYSIPRFDVLENVSLIENLCRATGVWFRNKNSKIWS